MELPISAHSHIKYDVNMVKATLIMISFIDNILQDMERECLNHLNVCLMKIVDTYSVLLISFFNGHSYIGKFTLKIT